jgi:hypothetical protein
MAYARANVMSDVAIATAAAAASPTARRLSSRMRHSVVEI